jgi:hypothetical protein
MYPIQKEKFIRNLGVVHPKLEVIVLENLSDKALFRCERHGDFMEIPRLVLRGVGCEACNFISVSTHRYYDLYDYSYIEYENEHENVNVICKEHGSFSVTPYNHIRGEHCPKCKL